ncbi:MAG: hypothetical protein ABIG31_06110 [Candidatus Omnitrophota bacterium]
MKPACKFLFLPFLLCALFLNAKAAAENPAVDNQDEGRYVLLVVGGANVAYQRSYIVSKTPALMLDSALGIVWRCKNLQEDRPVWIKTDLAKNKGVARLGKRYTVKALDYFGSEQKVPAVVLDTEEGKIWTCSNLLDDVAPWVQKDLVQEAKEPESKYKY